MAARTDPVGVILAGGEGRRIGGSKATVELQGQPLIVYPLRALRAVLEDVVILAKASTALPALAGVTVWIEPEVPRHPLHGILHALALAGGRRVLICAVDLPFVTPDLLRALLTADPAGAPAVVASLGERLQPLLGCYEPAALELLERAAPKPAARLTDAVAAIGPRRLEVDDPELLFNLNAPDDVLLASAMLDARRRART